MIQRLFLSHPRSVGESYPEHCRTAASFGWAMLKGALGCFVHAVVPSLCQQTGSDTVRRLHARLAPRQPHARPDYEI